MSGNIRKRKRPVLLTVLGLAATAANRFREHFKGDDSKELVFSRLRALPIDPTPAQVTAAIGNDSWTRLHCDHCDKDVTRVVQVGDEPDWESSTVKLCEPCLEEAMSLMKSREA